jgi:SAM-dependent methyltransferase
VANFANYDDEFQESRLAWDQQYKRGYFLNQPIQHELPAIIDQFKAQGIKHVLDHGCGSGRHVLYLAEHGFRVFALDIAPSGFRSIINKLTTKKLSSQNVLADILYLPYENECFDAIISVRVLHHNRINIIRKTVAEMWRILKLGGLVWVTVPVPKDHGSKNGQEIEPGTWVPHEGIEKGLPHHLFTEDELRELFHRFSIPQLRIVSSSHYSLLAQKPL